MTMQKVEIVLLFIIGFVAVATARPQLDLGFLTFKNGILGVNWGGYHAETHLGGSATGGSALGGLGASAGTPWGAHAEAGLGGRVHGDGFAGGQLYADAGLGRSGPQAGAGIGGEVSGQGNRGVYSAGATTGGVGVVVPESVESGIYNSGQPAIVGKTVKTVYQSVPTVEVVKTVEKHVSQSVPFKKEEIEVQKLNSKDSVGVQGETFLIAQPEVVRVEHKVRTHSTPKKEKTRVSTVIKSRVHPSVQSGVVVHKEIYPATNLNVQKYIETRVSPVQQIRYVNPSPVGNSASAGISGALGFNGGAFAGGYGAGAGSDYGTGYGNGYYVKSQPNAQLFDDIFNIPISTLTAVNQLLRNKGK